MKPLTARLGALFTALAIAVGAAGCGSGTSASAAGGQAKVNITFGYIGDYNGSAVLAAAAQQGLWAQAGITVTTKVFTNGPLQIQALGAGDLDFGYIGPGALWLPAEGKAKIIQINSFGEADRVIARPGSGIATVADLKGKKVAVPAGTSGDMILDLALQQAGLKPGDVTRVTMDPSTVVTAFSSGEVDAAAIWYPLIDTIKKKVPDLVELSKDSDFFPQLSFPSAFVTQAGLPAKDPALVKRVIGVLSKAEDWVAAYPTESADVTASFLKLPPGSLAGSVQYSIWMKTPDLIRYTEQGTVAGWLSGLAQVFVTMGELKNPGDPNSYYTGDLYTAAAGK